MSVRPTASQPQKSQHSKSNVEIAYDNFKESCVYFPSVFGQHTRSIRSVYLGTLSWFILTLVIEGVDQTFTYVYTIFLPCAIALYAVILCVWQFFCIIPSHFMWLRAIQNKPKDEYPDTPRSVVFLHLGVAIMPFLILTAAANVVFKLDLFW